MGDDLLRRGRKPLHPAGPDQHAGHDVGQQEQAEQARQADPTGAEETVGVAQRQTKRERSDDRQPTRGQGHGHGKTETSATREQVTNNRRHLSIVQVAGWGLSTSPAVPLVTVW